MRCSKCNAKLDIFGSSVDELKQCPLCGAALSAPRQSAGSTETGEESPDGQGHSPPAGAADAEVERRRAENDEPEAPEPDEVDLLLEGEEPSPPPSGGRTSHPEKSGAVRENTTILDNPPPPSGRASFLSVCFAVWMLFWGLCGLVFMLAASTAEFLSEGVSPPGLRMASLAGFGLLLTFSGAAALSRPATPAATGAGNVARRVLAMCIAAAGIFVFLLASARSGLLIGGEPLFNPMHVLAAAATAIALLALARRTWALRTVAITSAVLIAAALPAAMLKSPTRSLPSLFGIDYMPSFGFPSYAVPAAAGAVLLLNILFFSGALRKRGKKLAKNIFTYLWPVLLIAAGLWAVRYGTQENGTRAVFLRDTATVCYFVGALTLMIAGIAASWRTGNSFAEDMSRAAEASWGWAFALAAAFPILWLASGEAAQNAGLLAIGICVLLLLWVGWIGRSRTEDNLRWLARWEAAAFLIAALILLTQAPYFTERLSTADVSAPPVMLSFAAAWTTLIAALLLTGAGKLATSFKYYKNSMATGVATVCRTGETVCLVILLFAIAYSAGGTELRETFSRMQALWGGMLHDSLRTASGAWPVRPAAAEHLMSFALAFLSRLSPAIVIVLSLSAATVYRTAAKRIEPANYLAGLLTLAAVVTGALLLLMFTPLVFGSAPSYELSPILPAVLYGTAAAFTARFALSIPAFFRRQENDDPNILPWRRSYGLMLRQGMILCVITLFVTGMANFGWSDSELLFQVRGLTLALFESSSAAAAGMRDGWYGYRFAAAISILIALALHAEGLRGKKGARTGIAAIWTLAALVSWFFLLRFVYTLILGRPAPGETDLAAALALILGVLTIKVIGSWTGRSASSGRRADRDGAFSPIDASGAAALGRIGILTVSAAAIILVAWLLISKSHTERAYSGAAPLLHAIAMGIEGLRIRTEASAGAGLLISIIWPVSFFMLLQFYMAQFQRRRAALVSVTVFSLAVAGGLVMLGVILGRGAAGDFSPAAAWLFAGYCVALFIAAGASISGWTMLSAGE